MVGLFTWDVEKKQLNLFVCFWMSVGLDCEIQGMSI